MRKLLLAAIAGLAFSGAAHGQAVRLATEGAYAPLNFINEQGKPDGFEVELGNELCKRAALQCSWVTNAWESIIPNLVAGNYDAIMAGMSITDERKQTIDFSDNYMPADPSLYMVRSGTKLDLDNLSGKNIGVQGATIQAAYAQSHFSKTNTVKSYDTADQALADLNAGNVDVILADGPVVSDVVKGSSGAIEKVGPEVKIGNGIGIGLRKGDSELKSKLNGAIAAMKKDGSLDKMLIKWFPEKAPGPIFGGG